MILSPTPCNLVTTPWDDYGLIDSGDGQKLERFGPWRVIRPEPQCGWPRRAPGLWATAHAIFDPDGDEDEGRWRFQGQVPQDFPMGWTALHSGQRVEVHGRFTAFRHLALFPEQAANWDWQARVCALRPGMNVLNLFGYTGVASLVCAAAGARVTHVDASKKAIGWARENAALSGMESAPIRWICEDARKYVHREVRRGTRYDGIILDPPKYGRGPGGEVWRLFEDLPELMDLCGELLSETPAFWLVNAYAARISGPALAHMMAARLTQGLEGTLDYGELTLAEAPPQAGDALPAREVGLSFYARYLGAGLRP